MENHKLSVYKIKLEFPKRINEKIEYEKRILYNSEEYEYKDFFFEILQCLKKKESSLENKKNVVK